jgi:HEAT repeat protein
VVPTNPDLNASTMSAPLPGTTSIPVTPKARFRFSTKGVLTFTACVVLLGWAAKVAYEKYWLDPTSQIMLILRSDDPAYRRSAARELSGAHPREAARVIPALVVSLATDKHGGVREAAAQSLLDALTSSILSGTHDAEAKMAVDALFHALKDDYAEVRITAVRVLSGLEHWVNENVQAKKLDKSPEYLTDERCRTAFLALLADRNEMVRETVLPALGELASRGSIAPFPEVIAALRDPSPTVQAAAARSLPGYRENPDALYPMLFRALDTDNVLLKDAFSSALGQIRPSAAMVPLLTESLTSPNSDVRLRAAGALGTIGSEAMPSVPELIKILSDPADDVLINVRRASSMGLRADSVDPVCAAADSLSALCPHTNLAPQAIEGLTELAKSPHDWRRATAANALAKFGGDAKSALPTLIQALQAASGKNQVTSDASRLARAIGLIASRADSDGGAIAVLMDALNSQDPDVRSQAASALARFGDNAARAKPKMRVLLADRYFNVRAAAAKALNALGEKTDLPKNEP